MSENSILPTGTSKLVWLIHTQLQSVNCIVLLWVDLQRLLEGSRIKKMEPLVLPHHLGKNGSFIQLIDHSTVESPTIKGFAWARSGQSIGVAAAPALFAQASRP